MKLNNKGFAISTMMYLILIVAVVLVTLSLTILNSRKLILDKIKKEALNDIYNVETPSYRQVINTLKEEAKTYAKNNHLQSQEILVSNFNTSIESDLLEKYNLLNKTIKINRKNNSNSNNYYYEITIE